MHYVRHPTVRLPRWAGRSSSASRFRPMGRVVEATPAKPYLSLVVELDLPTMREVMEGMGGVAGPGSKLGGGCVRYQFRRSHGGLRAEDGAVARHARGHPLALFVHDAGVVLLAAGRSPWQ